MDQDGKPQKNKVIFLVARPFRPYLSLVATIFGLILLKLKKSFFLVARAWQDQTPPPPVLLFLRVPDV